MHKISKKVICGFMAVVVMLGETIITSSDVLAAEQITVSVDTSSTYSPTEIVNGDFSEAPWMTFAYNSTTYSKYEDRNSSISNIDVGSNNITPNGVGQGWNTTETKAYLGNMFEWSGTPDTYLHFQNVANENILREDGSRRYFVDMNCYSAGVLYQDLATQGGDIIRWTLVHAPSQKADQVQAMHVDIGEPDATPTETDSKIKSDSLGRYAPSGITVGSDSVAYANTDELKNLSVDISIASNPTTAFMFCAGVYIVPEGQSVTRFAFVSDAPQQNMGNLLSDLTFSTLIGNLDAVAKTDNSVQVTGYWGDADNSKQLRIKIEGETDTRSIDMSEVLNKNFVITIPASIVGNASSVEIYHPDYSSAKKTVNIHRHTWNYTLNTDKDTLGATCGGCTKSGEIKLIESNGNIQVEGKDAFDAREFDS